MKTILCFTLTLTTFITIALVSNTFAQDTTPEYVVRVVYFCPKDRDPIPVMDTKLDTMVKDIQKFYADEMERHGFGRKTFKFETDENGNVKVHHVKGLHDDVYYINGNPGTLAIEEIREQFDLSKNIYLFVIDNSLGTLGAEGGRSVCGRGSGGPINGNASIAASSLCFRFEAIAHELGHAFGLHHDFRSAAFMMSYGTNRDQLSPCAAEWLNEHRYFNPNPEDVNWNLNVEMLSPSLASPPPDVSLNVRFTFEVSDPDGLYQAQFLRRSSGGYLRIIACQKLSGKHAIVEFVTNELLGGSTEISVQVMDVHGNFAGHQFTVDITDLLPPSDSILIPDPSFAASIRRSLKLEPDEPITELDMLKLKTVGAGYVPGQPPVTDITGVEYAKNATVIGFFDNQISDITLLGKVNLPKLRTLWLGRNLISDITPLAGLTQLEDLRINYNQISDIKPLTGLKELRILELDANPILDYTPLLSLTQLSHLTLFNSHISNVSLFAELKNLSYLGLGGNQISDIKPLAELTNLEELWLDTNQISDIKPLAELENLEILRIGTNQISDISPLAELENLRELYIWDNQISDVGPLAGLENLRILYLKSNEISDVSPLTELVNLKELRLERNPIKNRKPLLALLRKNPDMKIYLEGHGRPLPVTLSHFRAEYTTAGVVLKWTTESEVDNAGFYIYRGETKDGEFKVVTPKMIQGAGTTGERNSYTWTDTTAKPNTVYYYRIEDVSHAGVREQLATVRLRGLVSASGKWTTRWADLRAQP